jgi:predicted GNAT family acetyltransferase
VADQPDQPDQPVVVHDPEGDRFTVEAEGHLAEIVYHRNGQRLVLVHTGVPDELEGRGIGGALVRAAIDHARAEGLIVVPRCPFARAWLERHPDVAERIDVTWERP